MSITRRRFLKATAATLPAVGLSGWPSNALAAPAPVKFVVEVVLRAGFHMNALFPTPGFRILLRHPWLNYYSSQNNVTGFTPPGGREVVFSRYTANQGADLLKVKAAVFQSKIGVATSLAVVPTTGAHTSAFYCRAPSVNAPCPAVLFSGANKAAIYWQSRDLPSGIVNMHPNPFPAPVVVKTRPEFTAALPPALQPLEAQRYAMISNVFSTQTMGGAQAGIALGSASSAFSAGALRGFILSLSSLDWHGDIPALDDAASKHGTWNLYLGGQLAALIQACSQLPDPQDASKTVLDGLFVSVSTEFARTSLQGGGSDNGDGQTQAFAFFGSRVRTGTYGDIHGTSGVVQGFDPITGNLTGAASTITEQMVYKTTGLLMGFSAAQMDGYLLPVPGPTASIPILVK